IRDGHRFNTLSQQIDAIAEAVQKLQQPVVPPLPVGGNSLAAQLYRDRRGEAVAEAGLNGFPVFALTAAPLQAVTLRTLFRGPDSPLVQMLNHPPEFRHRGFDLDVGET